LKAEKLTHIMSTECIHNRSIVSLVRSVIEYGATVCIPGSLSPAGNRWTWQSIRRRGARFDHWGIRVQVTRLCHPNACWTQLVTSARKKETSSSCLPV